VAVDAAARAWVVRLHSGDATDQVRAEFKVWLASNPAHAQAYRAHEQLMADLALVGDALAPEPTVRRGGSRRPASAPAGRTRAMALALAAASLLVVAGLGAAWRSNRGLEDDGLFAWARPPVQRTETAEIRQINLPDGSTVTLGARSRIRTSFSGELRQVALLEGEAFFDVASDPSRPFYVLAGDRMVRVVGTRFDVRRVEDTLRVAVVEGVVEVLAAAEPLDAEEASDALPREVLRAGEQVVARAGAAEVARSEIKPDVAAAWLRGWLAYEDASLSEILADANRYTTTPIELASPELGDVRITAAFGADGIDAFLEGLQASHGMIVVREGDQRILLMPVP
jgi:transmembrane sensor